MHWRNVASVAACENQVWYPELVERAAKQRLPMSLGDSPEPGPLPLVTAGHVTFGSFNQFDKLNPRVMRTWAKLLARCPGLRVLATSRSPLQPRARRA